MAIDAPRGTGRPSTLVEAPTVSLPKGGGAVRGIGDTFRANAANGTAAFSVPIPLSQGRSGSLLQLSLSYDSAGGNGPFGFGWTLVGVLLLAAGETDESLPTRFA